ncbi:hypothetical protein TSAR_016475 [Trichomalopsis sarcophagae]|uniref:Peptidase A2 domain-containing protein n=1 Tax=Trichomalopsis sarcophagae TaxID=543379 RepID=A0A232EKS5_9HYME|nr:hypothetical protein TSAR_016475 [Trichomalopsis sarcophagae]
MMAPLETLAVDIFIKGLPANLAERVDYSKPNNLREAYEEAVRIIIRTVIEVIAIEEEGIKTIMATKVNEEAIIITATIDSNNAAIGELGIAMETRDDQPKPAPKPKSELFEKELNASNAKSGDQSSPTSTDPQKHRPAALPTAVASVQREQKRESNEFEQQSAEGTTDGNFDKTRELSRMWSTNCNGSQNVDLEDDKATAVRIRIPVGTTKPWVEFMIDNGATVNLIKASVLDDDMPICTADARELGGITNQTMKTYASIYLDIKCTPVKFQIISDNFPIPFDGDIMHPIQFIGHEEEHNPRNIKKGYKCKQTNEVLNVESVLSEESEPMNQDDENVTDQIGGTVKYIIKARTRQVIQINIIKTELKEGYIPRIDVGNKHLFIGEDVVTNLKNTCKMMAITTSEQDLTI